MNTGAVLAILTFLIATVACGDKQQERDTMETVREPMNDSAQTSAEVESKGIKMMSAAFDHEGTIPVKFTCDGADVSPPLRWIGVPDSAKSLVLIMDDPDAPGKTWVHWVLYNIPPDTTYLPEHMPSIVTLEDGAVHGVTDFGRYGYGGPCPPSGVHRYFFKLYALDTMLDLPPKADKAAVVKAMEEHVLTSGEIMGKYRRQK
jgi:Raf kinase inhibitor-like YbhB/YbcL family protein